LAGKALATLGSINGPVVDSLQRIGGGGGVEASDPLLTVSQAQLDALNDIKGLLAPQNDGKGKTKVYGP
jgi:hypothetical protein